MRFESSSSQEEENELENPTAESENLSSDLLLESFSFPKPFQFEFYQWPTVPIQEGENELENPTAVRESVSVDVPLDIVEAKKLKKIGVKKIPMKLK
ncbi:hypothetical protein LguiB_001100 [Lonicera macranthoides]